MEYFFVESLKARVFLSIGDDGKGTENKQNRGLQRKTSCEMKVSGHRDRPHDLNIVNLNGHLFSPIFDGFLFVNQSTQRRDHRAYSKIGIVPSSQQYSNYST